MINHKKRSEENRSGKLPRHHLVISGTGRAGTTFLVQLLAELGLEIGFSDIKQFVLENCNAGLERDIRHDDAPYVVKSPWLCDYIDDVLASGKVVIDHAIVPVRDLFAAAESRRDVTRRSDPTQFDVIPGGVWPGAPAEQQEGYLAGKFHKLIHALVRHEVPFTLMEFPRLAKDPEYLYRKLRPALGWMWYKTFFKAFQAVSRPELIHNFKAVASNKA